MITHSYAKINLALHVLNKRADGFHNIETIFTSVNLKDRLTLSKSNDIIVETDNPSIPSGPENLAWKAASLVQKAFRVKKGVRIFIEKKIPAGGGLAGGSGNAAATVKALLTFWRLKNDPRKITRLLRKLGSDVPYCYFGGTMLGKGRGERLMKLPIFHDYFVVLVFPDFHIATPWAYQSLKRTLTAENEKINLYKSYRDLLKGRLGLDVLLHNDFEKAVFRKFPAIRKIKQDLLRFGAKGALMSGSGSTVFGLFESASIARRAAAEVRKNGFSVFLTETGL